jgi:hypothetical protein
MPSRCRGVAVHARARLVNGTVRMGALSAVLVRCTRAAQLGGCRRTRAACAASQYNTQCAQRSARRRPTSVIGMQPRPPRCAARPVTNEHIRTHNMPSLVAHVGGAGPVPRQMHMWEGRAQSRGRCGRGWQGWTHSHCGCATRRTQPVRMCQGNFGLREGMARASPASSAWQGSAKKPTQQGGYVKTKQPT